MADNDLTDYLVQVRMIRKLTRQTQYRTFKAVIPAPSEDEARYSGVEFGLAIANGSNGQWIWAEPLVTSCITVEPYEPEDAEEPW